MSELPPVPDHEHDGEPFDKHRARFAPKRLKIYGHTLPTWARRIAEHDAARIHSAISIGITSGLEATDIAHSVIGSRRNNGVEGATEITRQHIFRLGRGLLRKRKTLMRGLRPDVLPDELEK